MGLIVLAGAGSSLWGQTAGFAYVANFRSGDVSAYTIDGATGALMEVDGSPFPAGSGPWSVTVDPTAQFAYVATGGSHNVSAYSIHRTTRALTEIDGPPVTRRRPESALLRCWSTLRAVSPTWRISVPTTFQRTPSPGRRGR